MDKLKALFGDKALTYAELEAALKDSKEIKLANLASGQYVDIGKFKQAETQANDLQAQLAQRDKDLAELKKLDAAGIQAQLDTLKGKYADDTRALTEKLRAQTIDSRVELALMGAKAKNLTAAKALLKMDAITLDGDKVIGLDDQIKGIVKENPYLFGEPEQNPPPPGRQGGTGGGDDMAKWRQEAGLPPLKTS